MVIGNFYGMTPRVLELSRGQMLQLEVVFHSFLVPFGLKKKLLSFEIILKSLTFCETCEELQ